MNNSLDKYFELIDSTDTECENLGYKLLEFHKKQISDMKDSEDVCLILKKLLQKYRKTNTVIGSILSGLIDKHCGN